MDAKLRVFGRLTMDRLEYGICPSTGQGKAMPKELERVVLTGDYDARSRLTNVTCFTHFSNSMLRRVCQREMQECLLIELSLRGILFERITKSLTKALRKNNYRLSKSLSSLYSIEENLTGGSIRTSSARRNMINTYEIVVKGGLLILWYRRRLLRLCTLKDVARYLLEAFNAHDSSRVSVTAGHFAHTLNFAHKVLYMIMAAKHFSFLVLRIAQRQIRVIVSHLTFMLDRALANVIRSLGCFDEEKYAEICETCSALEKVANDGSRVESLSWRISKQAIAQVHLASLQGEYGGRRTKKGALICDLVMETVKILNACACWHDEQNRSSYCTRNVATECMRLTITRLWHSARQLVIETIAESLPFFGDWIFDNEKQLGRLVDISFALESLDAAQCCSLKYSHFDFKNDVAKNCRLIYKFVWAPYWESLQAWSFRNATYLLSCEQWISIRVWGEENHPTGVIEYSTLRKEIISVALASAGLFDSAAISFKRHLGSLMVKIPLRGKYVSSHFPTLIATRAALNCFQRIAIQCAYVAMIMDNTALYVTEFLLDLLESYFAGAAIAHLPTKDIDVPPCNRFSTQLARIVANNMQKGFIANDMQQVLQHADAIDDVESAIVAAESLLFVCKVFYRTANVVLECDPGEAEGTQLENMRETRCINLVMELRMYIFQSIGCRLVNSWAVPCKVASDVNVWHACNLHEECNDYVGWLVGQHAILWHSLVEARNNILFNHATREVIWTHIVQSTYESLVDGFARITQCSTEGRALMSMDLQVLQSRLNDLHIARPVRGAAYVDSYIKAWYFNGTDIRAWSEQNRVNYSKHHLDALLSERVDYVIN